MRKWTTISSLVVVFTLIILVLGGFFSDDESRIDRREKPLSNIAGELTAEESNDRPKLDQNIEIEGERQIIEGILVTRVIDGDTIEIEGGIKIRYIGIDTPETVHPTKGVECFGRQASEKKNRALVEGKKVTLKKIFQKLISMVGCFDTFTLEINL